MKIELWKKEKKCNCVNKQAFRALKPDLYICAKFVSHNSTQNQQLETTGEKTKPHAEQPIVSFLHITDTGEKTLYIGPINLLAEER